MEKFQINATKRADFGKKGAKQIRREGGIPCTIYGKGETVHFSVDIKDVKTLIYTPNAFAVEINIDGQVEFGVMREVQFHPVKEEILHIDFFHIVEGKPVTIDIPVRLEGNPEGVKMGGKLSLSKRKITVSATIENLPNELVVDVTEVQLGKSIFVGDLSFENLTLLTPATTAVCAVRMTRAARGAAAAAAAADKK